MRLIATIFVLLSYSLMPAQKLGTSFNEQVLSAHVHSLEEFISRINGDEIYPLAAGNDTNKLQTTRFSLFNINLINKAEDKGMMLAHEKEFVDALRDSDVKISMASPQSWIVCDFVTEYDGKERDLQIEMTMEEFKSDLWRWAISDVKGLESSGLLGSASVLPIDPIDHELGFMGMDHFVDTFHSEISQAKSSRREIDPLSFFLGLTTSGKLKIKYCQRVVFHTLQVPGWEMCAERVSRIDSSNSGWLITSISKISETNQSNQTITQ